MEYIIEHADQVTAEWLTAVLRKQGALPRGEVAGVTPGEARATFASSVWRLAVQYSPESAAGAPGRLFLKVSNPALAPGEFNPEQLKQEIDFYRVIAPAMAEAKATGSASAAAFVIPCYDAAYDPVTGAGHILLKDVDETHTACLEPDAHRCRLAIDALAGLHAFWWDHPRLGKDVGKFPTAAERERDQTGTEKSTRAFMAALGEQLLPQWRAAYEGVLAALPNLFRRHATGRNLTLAHGDAHLGNFLFPREGQGGGAYLLDWQFWHPTIGGTDLAFMMATGWEVETRRRLEEPLLRQYYAGLLAGGVRGYMWEECWDDYRLSVILVSIFIPVWQWAVFGWEMNLPGLEKSMAAFEDLKCAEMLAG